MRRVRHVRGDGRVGGGGGGGWLKADSVWIFHIVCPQPSDHGDSCNYSF